MMNRTVKTLGNCQQNGSAPPRLDGSQLNFRRCEPLGFLGQVAYGAFQAVNAPRLESTNRNSKYPWRDYKPDIERTKQRIDSDYQVGAQKPPLR